MNRSKTLKGILLAGLLAAAAGPLFGQNMVYNLYAGQTIKTLPDGRQVAMWGYGLLSYGLEGATPTTAVDTAVSVPGPRLTVGQGQGLVVNLSNELPVPVSILIPGQPLPLAAGDAPSMPVRFTDAEGRSRISSFVQQVASGAVGAATGPVEYRWPNLAPGTYLYHSGTHPAVQVQMGLYGALAKNAVDAVAGDATADPPVPPVPAQAYEGTASTYDQDLVFLYSEIDPALHAAVAGDPMDPSVVPTYGTSAWTSALDYHPKYFLVNGEADDDTALTADVTAAGSTVLLRFLNASLWDHAPQFLGTYVAAIAEDGKPYPYAREQYSLLLPAGKTVDAVLTPAAAADIRIFDRRLFRSQDANVAGSMLALIRVE